MGKISNYARVLVAKLQDVFVVDQTDNNVTTTKSVTVEQIGDTIAGTQVHSALKTDSQTIIGGINELAKDKNVADEYDDTHTYNTGDITIHENTLYICQDDNVTGAWDSTKWTATTIDDLIPKTDNNLPHYTGTPTAGSTAEAIGDLSTLTTTDKSSIVGAVNEVNAVKTTNIATTGYSDVGIALVKVNKVVQFKFTGLKSLPTGGWTKIADLPSGYRPKMETIEDIFDNTNRKLRFKIEIGGSVYVYNYGTAISSDFNAYMNLTYIIA